MASSFNIKWDYNETWDCLSKCPIASGHRHAMLNDDKQIIALEWNEPRFKLNYIIYSAELLRHKLDILTTIAVAITNLMQ